MSKKIYNTEAKYNLFADGVVYLTQSPHGQYQGHQAIDLRAKPLIAPWDGVRVIERGATGTHGEWFNIEITKGIYVQCVHGSPTKRTGSRFKAGEVMGHAYVGRYSYNQGRSKKGDPYPSHWHLAVNVLGKWLNPLVYWDRRNQIQLHPDFKNQKWKNWSTYQDRTITIPAVTQFVPNKFKRKPVQKPKLMPKPEIKKIQEEYKALEVKYNASQVKIQNLRDMLKTETELHQSLEHKHAQHEKDSQEQINRLIQDKKTLEQELKKKKKRNLFNFFGLFS